MSHERTMRPTTMRKIIGAPALLLGLITLILTSAFHPYLVAVVHDRTILYCACAVFWSQMASTMLLLGTNARRDVEKEQFEVYRNNGGSTYGVWLVYVSFFKICFTGSLLAIVAACVDTDTRPLWQVTCLMASVTPLLVSALFTARKTTDDIFKVSYRPTTTPQHNYRETEGPPAAW